MFRFCSFFIVASFLRGRLLIETIKYYLVILGYTMETISLKIEQGFLEDIERVMKRNRYTTKTEFIREAIRDKIKDLEKEEKINLKGYCLKLANKIVSSPEKLLDFKAFAIWAGV